MSDTYVDLTHTEFPEQLSKMINLRDPSAAEIPLINRFNTLMAQGQRAAAIEILIENPSLDECLLNADKLLKIYHSVIAVERYFFDNVLDKIFRVGGIKGDWNPQMASDAEGENKLNHFDVVRYPVDGVKQYFLVYEDGIQMGEIPTESEKYLQVTMKGDKGDDGYTPVKDVDYFDGEDGASGLGLSPRGAWVNNKEYWQYDMVSHNGYLFYCLEDNLAEEPTEDSSVWIKMHISLQSSVGTDTPTNLENGGLWMHLQDDGRVVMKTKSSDGAYTPLFPETKAKYVLDETGVSLQKKIYQHYFDRDDIKKTMIENEDTYTTTATLLSNPAVIVAKSVLTDALDTNGTVTEEFTAYDETGVFVMYKCKKVFADDGNGTYTCVPEVII